MKNYSNEAGIAMQWLSAVALIVFIILLAGTAHCQEQFIRQCATQAACQLDSGIPWSSPTRTYVFVPIQPNVSLRIWVHNNNPTSAHTAQTLTGWITSSTTAQLSLISQSDFWVQLGITQNSTTAASCLNVAANAPTATPGANGMGTCYTVGMYAAQIAIQFNPGGVQAGSPDTFDIGVVQQPSNYPGGPQPGQGNDSGDGTRIAGNGLFTTGSVVPTRQVSCFDLVSNTAINCLPIFGLGMTSSVGKGVAASINAFSGGGTDSLATGTTLSGLASTQGAASFQASSQMSAATANRSSTAGSTQAGINLAMGPASWTVATQAGTASNCSSSQAASASTQHCATGIEMCVSATAAQTQLFINLRDGATGAGTVKWNGIIAGAAGTFGCVVHEFAGGPICGTANTAMTLELSGNTAATNGCASTLKGIDVQ